MLLKNAAPFFCFFNDTATTEIYTLSLHDALPISGVGRKTANVVLSNAFGVPALAVDTHILRISKRLGLADDTDDAFAVEMKLNKQFPKELWHKLHHQLIFFGRYHCLARKPKCEACKMQTICPYFKKINSTQ